MSNAGTTSCYEKSGSSPTEGTERDPMITKALSWALRQMIKHQAAEVEAYVESMRPDGGPPAQGGAQQAEDGPEERAD